jgi:hypothetical protein
MHEDAAVVVIIAVATLWAPAPVGAQSELLRFCFGSGALLFYGFLVLIRRKDRGAK